MARVTAHSTHNCDYKHYMDQDHLVTAFAVVVPLREPQYQKPTTIAELMERVAANITNAGWWLMFHMWMIEPDGVFANLVGRALEVNRQLKDVWTAVEALEMLSNSPPKSSSA